ncbi:hypothetical protein [Streptomyces bohaiensis]|uniref:hypothetical protein n=1 Tax=Streptomyces bohaiensis TaxID=1431344 RepID=UPI003BA121B8
MRQVEKYFLTRASPDDLDITRATQTDTIQSIRWWSLSELRSTAETVYPLGLVDLLADVLTNGLPDEPALLQ